MRVQNTLLALGVVELAVIPLALVSPAQKGDEIFSGSDDHATQLIERLRPGYQRLMAPLWEPPSNEIESLLFGLQSALGAGRWPIAWATGAAGGTGGGTMLRAIDTCAHTNRWHANTGPVVPFCAGLKTRVLAAGPAVLRCHAGAGRFSAQRCGGAVCHARLSRWRGGARRFGGGRPGYSTASDGLILPRR